MLGCEIAAWLGPSPTRTPSCASDRPGTSSRLSAQALCPMLAPSTDIMRCRPRARRPASSGSTTTATQSRLMPSAVPSRAAPMLNASSSGKMESSWGSMRASSEAAKMSTTRCTTSPCSHGNPPGRTPNGDRQMVDVLSAVLTDGLDAVEAACAEALEEGVHSSAVVLNILARRREPAPPLAITTPDASRQRRAFGTTPRLPAGCRLHPLRQPQATRSWKDQRFWTRWASSSSAEGGRHMTRSSRPR